MAKKIPGLFTEFNGLWVRDSTDSCPPDHFPSCLNTIYGAAGVGTRDGYSPYINISNIVRMALYKPLPPFSGTHVPRILALDSSGNMFDVLMSTSSPFYSNAAMKDFGFVNFFGRCYISPSDGKVGLPDTTVKMYDGSSIRDLGGVPPTAPMSATWNGVGGGYIWEVGTWLVSYALETSSGFITQPLTPFIGFDTFGGGVVNYHVPIGPPGTKARWIIITKVHDLATIGPVGGPYEVQRALFEPLFFQARIGDNITTEYTVYSQLDAGLVNDASFLLTQLQTLPAGVGLIDYKGRMVSYGEYKDPSLVRVSEIGQPEAFSETSGFIITDPSDSTGVRSATEFRDTLYFFKQQRGYFTQDNTLEASTWILTNFDKSVGTEQYGIAAVLDAKGASADGFIIADRGALYYFNGVFVEPELSYKIRDLWLRISQQYFHKVQVSLDPINKRIYILVPLDKSPVVSHIIFGDYRDGLNALTIKWSLWQLANNVTSILTYGDFTGDITSLVTRLSTNAKIVNLNIATPSSDDGIAISSFFELSALRFSEGISEFKRVRIRGFGPCTLTFTAYGEDKQSFVHPVPLVIPSSAPGREYAQLMNLVSEYCRLRIECNNLNEAYQILDVKLDGQPLWDERPR
jgi:hypothetical protein